MNVDGDCCRVTADAAERTRTMPAIGGSADLARWSAARDRDHLVACLTYLYACVCACFVVAQLLLGASLASLAWTPICAAKSFVALALLLAQHRRIAVSLLPSIGGPAEPPSAWAALCSAITRKLYARARLAPAVLLAAAVVVRELLLLDVSPQLVAPLDTSAAAAMLSAPADAQPPASTMWITMCTPPGLAAAAVADSSAESAVGVPAAHAATHMCYAPELAMTVAWALLCVAAVLAGYGDAQANLQWPLLQQDLFLRLRPHVLPTLTSACRSCARASLLLLVAVALAPALSLSPPMHVLHALRIRHAPPAWLELAPAGARSVLLASRSHWLRLLIGGATFAACWRLSLLLVQAAYTQRLVFSQATFAPSRAAMPASNGASDPPHALPPLLRALERSSPPLTQHLAFLDLFLLARLEPRRRAELITCQSGAAFQRVLADCIGALGGLRERARGLGVHGARSAAGSAGAGGAAAPTLLILAGPMWQRWQHAVQLQLCCEALACADSACWAAHALAALLAASRAEDRFGTAQSGGYVGRALDAILSTLSALEDPALGALLPAAARGTGRASAQQLDGINTPQQRRMSALLPARNVRCGCCAALAALRVLWVLRLLRDGGCAACALSASSAARRFGGLVCLAAIRALLSVP